MSDIVIAATVWDELSRHLIRVSPDTPSPDEEFAYLFASRNVFPLGQRFVVHDMLPAERTDFDKQSPGGLRLNRSFMKQAIERCGREGWSLIGVHSHPGDTSLTTSFSEIDWRFDTAAMPPLSFVMGEPFRYAAMVVGQNSCDAHFYDPDTRSIVPFDRIIVIGESERFPSALSYLHTTSGTRKETIGNAPRYQRQELFFGKETQQVLANTTIAVVGAGGLGSIAALEFAHVGVGCLILVDYDVVEETNLNRLLGAGVAEIGQEKVAVLAKRIQEISPSTAVLPLAKSLLTPEAVELIKGADVLVGCVDNHAARLILNQIAVRYLLPLVDGGTRIEPPETTEKTPVITGHVHVVLPGRRCLECAHIVNLSRAMLELKPAYQQELDKVLGYNTGEVAPSVISLNGVIASLQVTEVLNLLAKQPVGKKMPPILLYDAVQRELIPASLGSSARCPTCGTDGWGGFGDLAPIRFAAATPPATDVPSPLSVGTKGEEV